MVYNAQAELSGSSAVFSSDEVHHLRTVQPETENVRDKVGTKPRKAAKSRILMVNLSATIQSLF